MHISTQGLVLRGVSYKELDKLLTVFTVEGGKRTAKARGCRRKGNPLAAAAQLLVYSDMTLFEYRDYFALNETESFQQLWCVRSSLERLGLASCFAEVVEAVAVEGWPGPPALSLIPNPPYALDRLNRPLEPVKTVFELKLICLEEYESLPDAYAMYDAPGPESSLFYPNEGMLCCTAYRAEAGEGAAVPLGGRALAAMRHTAYDGPKRLFSFRLGGTDLSCLSHVCQRFLTTQLDQDFRTLDFYQQWGNWIWNCL